jgi:hypothetical protein
MTPERVSFGVACCGKIARNSTDATLRADMLLYRDQLTGYQIAAE